MKEETKTMIRMIVAMDSTVGTEELSAIYGVLDKGGNDSGYVSRDVACELLGVSNATLYRMEKDGKIASTRISPRKSKFSREAIRSFLNGRR